MPLMPNLLNAEAVEIAVEADLRMHPRALPPDPTIPALTVRQDEVARWVCGRLTGELNPTPEETVAVNKGRHGIRPVAIWDLPSKVAYRALVERLAKKLPSFERNRKEWLKFQEEPLSRDGRYVVAADIAACYQQIDHGLLATELLAQTGEFEIVSAIVELLQQATGRVYGLPQQSYPSDWIAEPFLARLERAMIRRGLNASRYNDDFRFVCADWSEVVRTIEVFDEEVRRAGLTVNDQKTITWSRSKYEKHIDAMRAIRKELTGEEDPEIESDYTDEEGAEVEEEPAIFEYDVAEGILERWIKLAGRGRVADRYRAQHRVIVELVPAALKSLAYNGIVDDDVLQICLKLLRFERTVTPAVGQYFAAFDDDDTVLAAFDGLIRSRSYVNGWQIWWLQQSVARLDGFGVGPGATRRIKWLRDAHRSAGHSSVLRTEVARSLARHKAIELDELLFLYDRSSEIVRPSLASAIALLNPNSSIRKAVTRDSKLNEWAYEWATQWP